MRNTQLKIRFHNTLTEEEMAAYAEQMFVLAGYKKLKQKLEEATKDNKKDVPPAKA